VRLNESWKLDAPALAADFEKGGRMEIDAAASTATAKLVKAYKRDGRQFGVVEVRLVFPLKALRIGPNKLPLLNGAKMMAEYTGDGCIDGSRHIGAGKFRFETDCRAEINRGEQKFQMTLRAQLNGQESEKEVERK
jgi:hypothetical protein